MKTVPNATIVFDKDGNTVTLAAPAPGYAGAHERAQAIGRTAAGTVYVYDKAVTTRTLNLRLTLTKAQRDALVAWYDTHVQGALNTFTYTDALAVDHAGCRILNALAWQKTPGAMYRVDLEIETTGDVG